jgi:hypothetical protein
VYIIKNTSFCASPGEKRNIILSAEFMSGERKRGTRKREKCKILKGRMI